MGSVAPADRQREAWYPRDPWERYRNRSYIVDGLADTPSKPAAADLGKLTAQLADRLDSPIPRNWDAVWVKQREGIGRHFGKQRLATSDNVRGQ
ncbi:MAG: hypothetical protein ABI400_11585 [Lacisediminihabitans sp.]